MRYATDDDLGLFATTDLLPPLTLPNNLLGMQEEAATREGTHTLMALARRWLAERAERSWADVRRTGRPRAWTGTPAGPTPPTDSRRCTPYVLSADLRCEHYREACSCVGDLLYRHACATCGRVDAPRQNENTAVEDAMDHGWPGWREVPILASAMPDEKKQQTRWLAAATAAYPTGWIEAGGPVRTARGRWGRRHVPHRTPHGGYDMGVVVAETYLSHIYRPGVYDAEDVDQPTTP